MLQENSEQNSVESNDMKEKSDSTGLLYYIITLLIMIMFSREFLLNSWESRDIYRQTVRSRLISEQEKFVDHGGQRVFEHLEDLFKEAGMIADLVAQSGFDSAPIDYLEEIARHDIERNRVTEIYVVAESFSGKHPPVFAFEFDDDKLPELNGTEHNLEDEKEEYKVMMDQLEDFKKYGNNCVLSKRISLRARKKGFVLSVPIKSSEKLLGMVSMIVSVDFIRELVQDSNVPSKHMVLLTDTEGFPIDTGLMLNSFPPGFRISKKFLQNLMRMKSYSANVGEILVTGKTIPKPDGSLWIHLAGFPSSSINELLASNFGLRRDFSVVVSLIFGNGLIALSLILFIIDRKRKNYAEQAVDSLSKELALKEHVRILEGLIPICANCKRIRDDEGVYHQIEEYITNHSEVKFTHGICAECSHKLYPEFFEDDKTDK
ncbi:MAG: hypothetical protein HQ568_00240 [Calditrichaeota bacterium]|nr:hypothetical protein [Calditrichota bacterium]